MGCFWGAGVLYGYQTRDLSSVSIVVSLEERGIRGAQIRSLVWEKRVWSGKNEFGLGKMSLVWEKRVWSGKNELAVHKTCALHLGCCADRIELALSIGGY